VSLQENSELMRQHRAHMERRKRLSMPVVKRTPQEVVRVVRMEPAPVFTAEPAVIDSVPPAIVASGSPTMQWDAAPIRMHDIFRAVCEFYGVSLVDLQSARRTKRIVGIRHVAMYLCRALTIRSLPEIGRLLGNRDHTTILHGARKIAGRMVSDEQLAMDVSILIRRLTAKDPYEVAWSMLEAAE